MPARVLALALLSACSQGPDNSAAPANTEAEVDALARNLSAQADAWRDDTDNQETAAAAVAEQAAAENAMTAPANIAIDNRL